MTGDQPFLEATTTVAGGSSHDRFYVGYNANSANSTVNVFLDALAPRPRPRRTASDVRFPNDMPPTRTAIHSSGTIYCAFYSYNSAVPGAHQPAGCGGGQGPELGRVHSGVPGPGRYRRRKVGVRLRLRFPTRGTTQTLRIRVSAMTDTARSSPSPWTPNDVERVYIVYTTGTSAADEALHLRWSSDGGQNWSGDVRTIPKAKNPSLAINTLGMVGFVYQQVVGANWMTVLEVSDDGFVSSFSSHVLASTPTNAPRRLR